MEEALKDERFSHILKDPRFRKMPKNIRKLNVDKRFKQMFKDKAFKEKCQVNERGRPLNLTPSENLKNLYSISSDSSEDEASNQSLADKVVKNKQHKKNKHINSNKDKNISIKTEINNKEEIQKSNSKLQKQSIKQAKMKTSTEKIKIGRPEQVDLDVIENEVNTSSEEGLHEDLGEEKEIESKELSGSEDSSNAESEKSDSELEKGDSESEKSDSESDESDSESEGSSLDKKEDFDHRWEELREEAPDTDEITRRIAVCNMDWDRIRADDLFAVFDSFKPSDGSINSVKIYPSEYGLKRMEEEKLRGPPELVEKVLDPDEEEVEDKKGSKYHREKLRQYQMNRLKYYYAVVDCDSAHTANTLYEQLNGMEYESSSVRFDLRFIPDDVTFDHEPSSTSDKMPDPTEYKPRLFVTTALQQVKVNLTWDETDPKRREVLQKAFTDPDSIEKDIKDYLASTSGDSEDEDEEVKEKNKLSTKERIAKYKELLQSLEEKEKEETKYEMEITWEPGLKEKTEKIVKDKMQDSLNPFDELLKKKKEDRKLKKKGVMPLNNETTQGNISGSEESDEEFFTKSVAHENGKKTQDRRQFATEKNISASEESDELFTKGVAQKKVKETDNMKQLAELSLMSDSKKIDLFEEKLSSRKKDRLKSKKMDNFKAELSLLSDPKKTDISEGKVSSRKKNKMLKSKKLDDFKCDVSDPRFSAIYSSPMFNIDPSDPHFKRTEGNLAIIQEKQKKLRNKDLDENRSNKRIKRY